MLECAEDAEMDEDDDEDDEDGEAGAGGKRAKQVWIPGKGGEQPEHLEVDNSTYEMLHRMNVEWPMLSFDFVADNLGQQRTRFPMTAYAAGGTQADQRDKNKIILMKMHQLHRTKYDDGSGSESDDSQEGEDDLDDDPELQHVSVPHNGAVNRLRVMPQQPGIMATWADTGKVHLWDLNAPLHGLAGNVAPATSHQCDPIFTNDRHKDEGYAMSWSYIVPGQLATGDCKHKILRCRQGQKPPNPATRNPKPETRNPKPETRNPKPETRHRTPSSPVKPREA
jgi:ribosome assembly protein RRB1